MPGTKCPTVRSGGTTSVRSALMPILMNSRASMETFSSRHSGARGARARNPYSRWWLWVPGLRQEAHPGTTASLLHRLALDEGLAALHLVGQRCLVDLDHHRVGIDAEILHQRLGDVAHHAGLLLVGAASGHAHGNLRHLSLPVFSCSLAGPGTPII